MPTPLPAIRPPDYGKTLDAFRTGKQDFLEQQKRDLLQEAGGLAAAGNMAGAKNKLYAGGDFAQAQNISGEMRAQSAEQRAIASHAKSLDDMKLAKAAKSQELLGNMARMIKTPEQLEQAKAILSQRGLDASSVTFEQLPMLIQQGVTAQQAYQNELEERRVLVEEGKALAASGKNDLIPVAPGTTLYDRSAGKPAFTAPEKPQAAYEFTKGGIGNKFDGSFKPYEPGANTEPGTQMELGKYEQGLRKEWSALSADNKATNDSINRMRLAVKSPSGAGDVALIYSYMKMLDPNAAVMEGDYAKAQNTAGIPSQIVALYNKAIDGQFLVPEQRSAFLRMGESISKDRNARFQKARSQFENIAKSSGADPARVMLDEGESDPQPLPSANPGIDLGGKAAASQFPSEAIADLRADSSPKAQQEFDAIFGQGAARRALGN